MDITLGRNGNSQKALQLRRQDSDQNFSQNYSNNIEQVPHETLKIHSRRVRSTNPPVDEYFEERSIQQNQPQSRLKSKNGSRKSVSRSYIENDAIPVVDLQNTAESYRTLQRLIGELSGNVKNSAENILQNKSIPPDLLPLDTRKTVSAIESELSDIKSVVDEIESSLLSSRSLRTSENSNNNRQNLGYEVTELPFPHKDDMVGQNVKLLSNAKSPVIEQDIKIVHEKPILNAGNNGGRRRTGAIIDTFESRHKSKLDQIIEQQSQKEQLQNLINLQRDKMVKNGGNGKRYSSNIPDKRRTVLDTIFEDNDFVSQTIIIQTLRKYPPGFTYDDLSPVNVANLLKSNPNVDQTEETIIRNASRDSKNYQQFNGKRSKSKSHQNGLDNLKQTSSMKRGVKKSSSKTKEGSHQLPIPLIEDNLEQFNEDYLKKYSKVHQNGLGNIDIKDNPDMNGRWKKSVSKVKEEKHQLNNQLGNISERPPEEGTKRSKNELPNEITQDYDQEDDESDFTSLEEQTFYSNTEMYENDESL